MILNDELKKLSAASISGLLAWCMIAPIERLI